MWLSLIFDTSNMAASVMALAVWSPISPLLDSMSSTTWTTHTAAWIGTMTPGVSPWCPGDNPSYDPSSDVNPSRVRVWCCLFVAYLPVLLQSDGAIVVRVVHVEQDWGGNKRSILPSVQCCHWAHKRWTVWAWSEPSCMDLTPATSPGNCPSAGGRVNTGYRPDDLLYHDGWTD